LEKKDLRDMQKDLETAPTALRGAVGQASMPKPAQAIGMGQQKYTNIPNPDSLHLRGPSWFGPHAKRGRCYPCGTWG